MLLLVIDFGLAHNAPQLLVYPPTCTTLGLTRACIHTKWVSWVDSVSSSGVESVSPRMRINCAYVPLLPTPTHTTLTHTSPPETNTRYHSNHALSRIRETHAKRTSGVDSTSPHGAHPGVLSDTHTECVTQNVNCGYVLSLPNPTPADIPHISPWNKHQTPCKPCTKQDVWNQTWYSFTENSKIMPQGHFVP